LGHEQRGVASTGRHHHIGSTKPAIGTRHDFSDFMTFTATPFGAAFRVIMIGRHLHEVRDTDRADANPSRHRSTEDPPAGDYDWPEAYRPLQLFLPKPE
jgi:hypothetical protein